MIQFSRKIRRLREAAHIVLGCGADQRSRRMLAGCYWDLGAAMADHSEMDLRLRFGRQVVACRMRRSDIFTLAEIFHEGQYELSLPLPECPTIVDAGANIGLVSLWFLGHRPGAAIHAFEPEPENARLLESNLAPFERATVNQMAVGKKDGAIELGLAEHSAMHSTLAKVERGGSITVHCTSLASYLDEVDVGVVDLLKLDVEGAEQGVIEGLGEAAGRVLRIVGEVHERLVDAPSFYKSLGDAGFKVCRTIEFRDGGTEGVHGFEAVRA